MSAETRSVVVTRITCDASGCKTKEEHFGRDKEVRKALNASGWVCGIKARTDLCPVHKNTTP